MNIFQEDMMRLILLLVVFAFAVTGDEAFTPPVRSVSVPGDFSQQPVPRLRNGFLIGIDTTRTRVRIWDRDGALKVDTVIAVPSGEQTMINDVAVSGDGSFAVAATISAASSRSAILWYGPAGAIRRVSTTSPFSPKRLAFQSNGELWAVGWVKDDPEGATVRVYGATGDLRRTALPSANGSHLIRDLHLSLRANRVAVISFSSGKWFDLDLDGRVVSEISLPVVQGFVTGAAVTAGGHLYVSSQNEDGTWPICRLDVKSKSWIPVDRAVLASDPSRQASSILGTDGDSLTLRTKPPNAIQWVRVE
jgi:hypothetical protein